MPERYEVQANSKSYTIRERFFLKYVLYFIIHVGYNVGLLPTTGLPLPFVSYGGSHTIFNLFQIGLLLSISYRIKNGKS